MPESDAVPDMLGVVPVLPIPFDDHEEIDEPALRRLVDFAVSCKVKAVCLPMYGSEYYKLSDEERTRVVSITVDQAAKRLLVIGNCAHGSARMALSFGQANVKSGADMISAKQPGGIAPSHQPPRRGRSSVSAGPGHR